MFFLFDLKTSITLKTLNALKTLKRYLLSRARAIFPSAVSVSESIKPIRITNKTLNEKRVKNNH